jgi:hypothetical protein
MPARRLRQKLRQPKIPAVKRFCYPKDSAIARFCEPDYVILSSIIRRHCCRRHSLHATSARNADGIAGDGDASQA